MTANQARSPSLKMIKEEHSHSVAADWLTANPMGVGLNLAGEQALFLLVYREGLFAVT